MLGRGARSVAGFDLWWTQEDLERELCTIPLMALNLFLGDRAQVRLAERVWALDERLMARFPALRKRARISFLILK